MTQHERSPQSRLADKIEARMKLGLRHYTISGAELDLVIQALRGSQTDRGTTAAGADGGQGRKCQKCGALTHYEEAWVDGQIWCHPCADEKPGPKPVPPARNRTELPASDVGFTLKQDPPDPEIPPGFTGKACR